MSYGARTYAYRGDPGIFGTLGNILKGATSIVSKVAPGPIGSAAGFISKAIPSTTKRTNGTRLPVMPGGTVPSGTVVRTPGVQGFAQRLLPGGATGYTIVGKKRRRMNPANPKALRRAIRRQAGFVKLARRALKGSGYTIATAGSRRRRTVVKEAGPGSVYVQ